MFKRLLTLMRDSLVYGAGSLVSQVLNLLLLPLYTRGGYLDPEDFGVLQMLLYIPMIFIMLAAAGMKSAVFQQYHRTTDDAKRRVALTTAAVSVSVSTAVLLLIGVVLADPLSQLLIGKSDMRLVWLVRLTLCGAAMGTLTEIPTAILQSQRRIKTVASLDVLQLLITIGITIFFVVFLEWGVLGVVLGGLIGRTLDTLINLGLAARSLCGRIDLKVWRTMSAYALPFLPHRLLAVLMVFFGEYILRVEYGLAQTGLYGAALKFTLPILFVSGAIQQAWTPYKFKVFAEDPDPAAFFRSIFTYFIAGILYLWVGLSLWGPDLLRLMTSSNFHAAATLIWAVCLMRVMQAIYPMLSTGVEVGKNTRAVPLSTLAGLLTALVTAVPLVREYGALGAALATALAWGAVGIGIYFVAQRQIYIRYDLPTVAALAVLAVVSVVLGYQAQTLDLWVRLPVFAGLSLLFPLLAFLILLRSETERHRMEIIWRKLLAMRRTPAVATAAEETEAAVPLQ